MSRKRLTARDILDRHTPEADFMDTVVEAALRLGWLVFHLNDQLLKEAVKSGRLDALTGIKDFPDLVMVHPVRGQLAVLECKTERGTAQDGQQEWLDAWRLVVELLIAPLYVEHVDHIVMIEVVRPSDWDRIEAFLKGERP